MILRWNIGVGLGLAALCTLTACGSNDTPEATNETGDNEVEAEVEAEAEAEGSDATTTTTTSSTSTTGSGASDEATSTANPDSSTTAGDGDGDASTSPDSSGDGDTTTTSSTSSGDGDGDGDGDDEQRVRFIAFGDGGEGNEQQYAVSTALEMVCADKGGCDFALYLGDNFYDSGVDAVTDEQFTTKFEAPYANLDLPFFITLGNHDYNEGLPDWNKSSYQVEYTQYSDKWTMPSEYYDFMTEAQGPDGTPVAHFFALDTHRIFMNHEFNSQQAWYEQAIAGSESPWKITFGHHPYISNGRHGNAGSYENVPFVPIINGEYVEEFIADSVCGASELFFSGHDHNRQVFEPVCGTRFIVSGAAAKTTDFEHYTDDNPTLFEDDQWTGFMLIELTATGGTLEAWGVNAANLDDYQLQYTLDLGAP